MGRRLPLRRIALPALVLAVVTSAVPVGAAGSNWPAYLFNAKHGSYNASAKTITPANAATLSPAWTWTPPAATMPGQPVATLASTPAVSNGLVFIGASTGIFYALDEDTGAVVWQRFVAFVRSTTCAGRGFVSSPTIARDPVSKVSTVYVAAADGRLYALRASDGAIVWSTQVVTPSATVNDYYLWSSPTVANGRVYLGISSQCDDPLVTGGLAVFDQATGHETARYVTVPAGSVGGSIWSSAAATSDGFVWVTTGNEDPSSPSEGDSNSIVRLKAPSLAKKGIWTVPVDQRTPDGDFGASPTIFTASVSGRSTRMVGACNKNGVFYAMKADSLGAGPVWSAQVGEPGALTGDHCQATAIWDGARLIVAGNRTTIGGTGYAGSVRSFDPSTGSLRWETGLTGPVFGSPTEDGAGVVAAATWGKAGTPNAAYLLDATNGNILATIGTGDSRVFAQPVFAGPFVLIATWDHGLIAYRP